MPMRMIVQERMNAGLASAMKLSLALRMMWSIGMDLSKPLARRKSKMSRVTTKAVNKLAATPQVREKPKPLMEPVPMFHKMMEEIRVVTCESRIVLKARLYPADRAPRSDL